MEKKLYKSADKFSKNMDDAQYKHVALDLIFLKYFLGAFDELRRKLVAQKAEGSYHEDKNEYLAESVFYMPSSNQSQIRTPTQVRNRLL